MPQNRSPRISSSVDLMLTACSADQKPDSVQPGNRGITALAWGYRWNGNQIEIDPDQARQVRDHLRKAIAAS